MQLVCKVCSQRFQIHPRHSLKAKFWCPHCGLALYLWKRRKDCSIYKCDNDHCPLFSANFNKLNPLEKTLRKSKSSQFKLRYQFREYHFTEQQLALSAPQKMPLIFNIRQSLHTLCLILTFHVSLGISARKTAFILTNVFALKLSYQTVLNYSLYAAHFCHRFNLHFKGDADVTQVGDETYIKIAGDTAYTFFFLSPERRKISAYHVDHSRDTLPATITMREAIRTAPHNENITLITDGNPSYPAGIHFLNLSRHNDRLPIAHKHVIGLQNLDQESEDFRPFKQLMERLNRTYKFHTRSACGFNSDNGAIALTTLFVTHYNFLRPHTSLDYEVPIPLDELNDISTFQGKWAKLLNMAFSLN